MFDSNLYLFQKINGLALHSHFFDLTGIFFAKYCGYLLILLIALFFLLRIRRIKQYLGLLLEMLLSVFVSRIILTEIIRKIFPSARPFVAHKVNLLLSHAATNSFPSGHTAFFFALSTTIYFYNKKLGWLFFAFSFLIGVGRIFCGVHWPVDILGGIFIGVLSGILVRLGFVYWKKLEK